MTTTFTPFEVGGCIRDELLGLPIKDVDFVVVVEGLPTDVDPFAAMVDHLLAQGFPLHVVTPDTFTARFGVPEGHPLRARTKDADFVLARREWGFTDGRRPDHVAPGTLLEDLARRDFTVNAVAKDPVTGELIDPHGGVADARAGVLRFVGDPADRIREDALRVLRGLRLMVVKGLAPTPATWAAFNSDLTVEMLGTLPAERFFEEFKRLLAHDTLATLDLLERLDRRVRDALFPEPMRFTATLARPKGHRG
jgi:tRNA nucleotidyltransferase/poly(A) polymerase